jgi:hypothetical protein
MLKTDPYDVSFTIPKQLDVDELSFTADLLTIYASTTNLAAERPLCRQPSRSIHGCYARTLADPPWCGTPVRFGFECASSSATFPPASVGSSPSAWMS